MTRATLLNQIHKGVVLSLFMFIGTLLAPMTFADGTCHPSCPACTQDANGNWIDSNETCYTGASSTINGVSTPCDTGVCTCTGGISGCTVSWGASTGAVSPKALVPTGAVHQRPGARP